MLILGVSYLKSNSQPHADTTLKKRSAWKNLLNYHSILGLWALSFHKWTCEIRKTFKNSLFWKIDQSEQASTVTLDPIYLPFFFIHLWRSLNQNKPVQLHLIQFICHSFLYIFGVPSKIIIWCFVCWSQRAGSGGGRPAKQRHSQEDSSQYGWRRAARRRSQSIQVLSRTHPLS